MTKVIVCKRLQAGNICPQDTVTVRHAAHMRHKVCFTLPGVKCWKSLTTVQRL
jgi:hypothetical protein